MMNAKNMGKRWVDGWNSKDSVAFSMLYSSDGKYIDPSFGIVQRGRDAIRTHHEKWWNAIPDFKMVAERVHVGRRRSDRAGDRRRDLLWRGPRRG
jgi:uncharacterized protein (TIGR02246 family)